MLVIIMITSVLVMIIIMIMNIRTLIRNITVGSIVSAPVCVLLPADTAAPRPRVSLTSAGPPNKIKEASRESGQGKVCRDRGETYR